MNQSPEYVEFSYTKWREGFLRTTLIGASIFGLAALIAAVFGVTAPIYRILYISLYVILLIVTVVRVPYSVKAATLIVLVFSLGVSGLIETGIWGDSRVFMLGAITLASLLFSWRAGWMVTGLTMLSYIIAGWLVLSGRFQITSPSVIPGDFSTWASGSTAVLLLAVLIINGIRLTQNEFGKAQTRAESALNDLRAERNTLEVRVEDRTQDLAKANQLNEYRVRLFQAVAEVARAVASIRDVEKLLPMITTLISERFGYYHAGVFLLDEAREYAVLSATNSEGGKQMLERGYKLRIGETGIVGNVAASGIPRIALDTGSDAVYFKNPFLPNTRSEMALPLLAGNTAIGVLDVQSTVQNAFSEDDITILTTLADQVTIAIQNANLFQETQTALNESQILLANYVQRAWNLSMQKESQVGYRFTGITSLPIDSLADNPQILAALDRGKTVTDRSENGISLATPINLRGEIIGVFNINLPADKELDADEIEIIEAVANRVALALENATLLEESQHRASKEQIIGEISTKIGNVVDIDNIIETAVRELGRSLPGANVAIQLQS